MKTLFSITIFKPPSENILSGAPRKLDFCIIFSFSWTACAEHANFRKADFPYHVGRAASKSSFKYKLSKQITCFAFKIVLSWLAESNAVSSNSDTQTPFWSNNPLPTPDSISLFSPQNLVEGLTPLRNLLTHISTWKPATRVFSRSKRENFRNEVSSRISLH